MAVGLAVVGGVGWEVVHKINAGKSAADDPKKHPHDLPVVVATARRGNLPVYLYGLGTVTPLKT